MCRWYYQHFQLLHETIKPGNVACCPNVQTFISVDFLVAIGVCFVLTQIQRSTQHKDMIPPEVMYSLHYKMFYGTDLFSGQHCLQSRQGLRIPSTFEFLCMFKKINFFSKYTRENDEENINTRLIQTVSTVLL